MDHRIILCYYLESTLHELIIISHGIIRIGTTLLNCDITLESPKVKPILQQAISAVLARHWNWMNNLLAMFLSHYLCTFTTKLLLILLLCSVSYTNCCLTDNKIVSGDISSDENLKFITEIVLIVAAISMAFAITW